MITVAELKKDIESALKNQGFILDNNGRFFIKADDRESRRKVHEAAKAERILKRRDFINRYANVAGLSIPDGRDIDVEKIDPVLIEIKPNTDEENYFRWWNLVWWSLPYERAYGRQMRFLVWDNYHHAVIGLIGLQSPILRWAARDDYLGIDTDGRDFWINQSLSAQRLGAVPPYNQLLGGKLVALLLTSDRIRGVFRRKYHNVKTLMNDRTLPARLLFITTTGAYGKSSVYQRLKYDNTQVAEFIGYSQGSGTFHIPNGVYERLLNYLEDRDIDTTRGYGGGPSRKLRLIDTALNLLGYRNGVEHGISRAVYLFPLVKNLHGVIQKNRRPQWHHRSDEELANFWKERWAIPRSERILLYRDFKASKFLNSAIADIQNICSEKK